MDIKTLMLGITEPRIVTQRVRPNHYGSQNYLDLVSVAKFVPNGSYAGVKLEFPGRSPEYFLYRDNKDWRALAEAANARAFELHAKTPIWKHREDTRIERNPLLREYPGLHFYHDADTFTGFGIRVDTNNDYVGKPALEWSVCDSLFDSDLNFDESKINDTFARLVESRIWHCHRPPIDESDECRIGRRLAAMNYVEKVGVPPVGELKDVAARYPTLRSLMAVRKLAMEKAVAFDHQAISCVKIRRTDLRLASGFMWRDHQAYIIRLFTSLLRSHAQCAVDYDDRFFYLTHKRLYDNCPYV